MGRASSLVSSIAASLVLSIATFASAQPCSSSIRNDLTGVHAPRAIAVADISGDGWNDIVLAGTNPPTVTVIPNSGIEEGDNGPFRGPLTTPVSGGPFDLAIGDLDRDGKLDIAV